MAFQLSPGVLVVERDLTGIVPAVATSIGGYVGAFQWGPVGQVTNIGNEGELVSVFGKPNDEVAASFFSAANFLAYSNNLRVVRVVNAGANNAMAAGVKTFNGASVIASMSDNTMTITAHGFDTGDAVVYSANGGTAIGGLTSEDVYYVIKVNDNTIKLATSAANATAGTAVDLTANGVGASQFLAPSLQVKNLEHWEDVVTAGLSVGQWAAKYPGELGNSLAVSIADADNFSGWDYENEFDAAPGTSDYAEALGGADDELHIVVVDEDGLWSGTPGSVLEKFAFVSKARDAKRSDGTNAYYVDVLKNSRYIWWMSHQAASNWGSKAEGITFTAVLSNALVSLSGGISEDTVTDGQVQLGWDLFENAEEIDVNLLFVGPYHGTSMGVAEAVISIAESRMDCLVFVSPQLASVYNRATQSDAITSVLADRNNLPSTSYAAMDSGWKYQYDKYNDKYRWVPLNADIAGLCARTDNTNDPWYSPGGLNRGQIKNVTKLAWSPKQSSRDSLYKSGVNPVVTFTGEGTVLYGDKTLLARPSAFDRINVRRLFIVLEKSIAVSGRYQIFEFNDVFTRSQFRSIVEPFLRDVVGRRGITDFRVVCDETNNTAEVQERNEFVADIYIKPARSINFMKLNFIATRTGVNFEEIVGS
jgi:phage tail sheath protein FI